MFRQSRDRGKEVKLISRGKQPIIKFPLAKWGIICLAVLVALGTLGVTYAKWVDKPLKKDRPIQTAQCSDPFTWVATNDDGHLDERGIYTLPDDPIDPGDDGSYTEYSYWQDSSSSDDPGSYPAPGAGQAPGDDSFPRYTKDVARTTAWLEDDPHFITVVIDNAYPYYYSTVFFALTCLPPAIGTIEAIVIDEIANDTSEPEPDVIEELTVTYSGIYIGQQITSGEEALGALHILVNQAAEQNATYTIRLSITTVCGEIVEPGECDGGVTELTLRYNGAASANITVWQNKPAPTGDWVFGPELVQPGQVFTVNGTWNNGRLGTEISLYVDGTKVGVIHTSCSVEVGPGLVVGPFEVISGESRNGGPLPPVPW